MTRFLPGDRVRVRSTPIDTHHRTPGYVKGKAGRVQALAGSFYDPQLRAYGGRGLPKRALYRVEFQMRDLWGEDYGGPTADRLLVDIFEQWLEGATDPVGSVS